MYIWKLGVLKWWVPPNHLSYCDLHGFSMPDIPGMSQDEIGYSAAMHSCVKARRALAPTKG